MSTVVHLVPGPDRHGVTRHALDLLGRPALADHRRVRLLTDGDTTDAVVRAGLADLPPAALLHLHLTDHLLGPTAGDCARIVGDLARRRPTSLTLHDLPQPADGPGRYERRRAAYAAMAAQVRGVIVASAHERDLLAEAARAEGTRLPPVEVVPLPIEPPVGTGSVEAPTARRVVVFGFVYPGKGHAEVIEALADLPEDVGLLALGTVSPGHEEFVDRLGRRAAELGRDVEISGYVADDEVLAALQRATVPVAPHLHVSASGSISSWLTAGRRPLVPAGTYVDELEARCPGALFRYGPGLPHPDLASAVAAALEDPALTRLDAVRLGPTGDEAAEMLARVLESWAVDPEAAS